MPISLSSATLSELALVPEAIEVRPTAWRRFRARLQPSFLLNVLSGAPWSWALLRDDGSPARYLHRTVRRQDWRQQGTLGHILMAALFVVGMPIVSVAIAVCAATHGARVWKQQGKNPLRQALEQIALWLGQGVLPFSYYVFELHRDRTLALEYLYRYETKQSIYPILRQRFSSPKTTEGLSDKALFARICQQHGVPAIPALFVIDHGRLTRYDSDEPGLPRRDLFLKPVTGSGGGGAELWRYVGDQRYSNAAAGVVPEAQLTEHLTRLSEQRPYVGRAYVTNHPVLAEVSSGALCSVRVMTCLNEHNQPEVTHAVLRMPRTPGIIVDNFHAGGLAAAVEVSTGIIGQATDLGTSRHTRWWDAHPTTGASIVGRRIPMWDQVLAAAVQAHTAFADQIVVGWDVAVLEDGPQLIEGNKGPDLDIVQRTGRKPVGNSRLGVLIAYHLRRALSESDQLSR